MIPRFLTSKLQAALASSPVVALLGPRQVGKTTLAHALTNDKPTVYLDLELPSDLAKLSEPEAYLKNQSGKLIIIDEAQRAPELFPVLRSIVDARKRAGESSAQFLLLGSASRDLLSTSSETLAGRIQFLELAPLNITEIANGPDEDKTIETLWLRGGFPDSYLATTDESSWTWRHNFIATYLERDIPLLGPRSPATRMRRLWTMLAHLNGQQVNFSNLARSLETSHTTIRSNIDTLTDFYMLRQLQPWAGNTKRRLVKSPKIYLRDTGLLHNLLNIDTHENLLGHPGIGASWEGFAIENILSLLDSKWRPSYYRTATQSEIDLILEGPGSQRVAIEIKRSAAPKIAKGFHDACSDIQATRKIVLHGGTESYPLAPDTAAIPLTTYLEELIQKT